jgi:diguanylate cyclase (GGDEF)-like protein
MVVRGPPVEGVTAATPEFMSSAEHASRSAVQARVAPVRLVPEPVEGLERAQALVESYRGLADVFHDVLSEQSLDALLERIADTLGELVPYEELVIYEVDASRPELLPVLVRSEWAEEIINATVSFGQGITGWAVEHREPVVTNAAHLDPRVRIVPGTPVEPEALIVVPLIARGALKGALNIYRIGDDASFNDDEFELAKRYADAAALALDNAQIRARLEHQAQTDGLTGLYNHRYFHERLRAELQRASRSHAPVGVLMLDIDDFKRANDIYGHAAGDEILVQLAATLRATARGSDVVCRLGGEEFAVIMPGTDALHAEYLAERITEQVAAQEFEPSGRLTLSIGLAEGPEHASNPRELISCAEAAMMTAKARGKNQVVYYGEGAHERPESHETSARGIRSIAHLKMLQSLAGKLNRLNDTREIGMTIANELRSLIDYHNCRVSLVESGMVVPIAFRGDLSAPASTTMEVLKIPVGFGITGHVVSTGEPLLTGDAANCEFGETIAGTQQIDESLLAVPLRYGSRVIGAIVVSKLGFDQFDEDDLRLLEVLAGHAAVALENARLYEAERREAESAKALLEFARELATAHGLEDVLARTVSQTARIIDSARTSVWLQDQDSGELVARALHGYDEDQRTEAFNVHHAREFVDRVLVGDDPFLLGPEHVEGIDRAPQTEVPYLVAPLVLDDGTRGCIAARMPDRDADSLERPLRLLAGLAHQAKLAIANANSFEHLEETFIDTVEALANALEANDEYTSSHARGITDLSIKVGKELGLASADLKRLELGALFHDIGKIGIPSDILSKPGKLTPEERVVMETHPELGEKIIAPISRLEDVRPIVRHCHERWDGHGYPDRIGGELIPLESRIVFVCDAFHAMTTDRPYRRRLPNEEARRRLLEGAGTQFDRAVVEVFVRLLDAHGDELAPA